MLSINRELLERYMQGACSPEEEQRVVRWLDENDIEEFRKVHSEQKYLRKEEAGWQALTHKIEALRSVGEKKRSLSRGYWWKIAAAIAGLVVLSFYLYKNDFFHNNYEAQYQTTYGEVKRITLSDGSMVTLN